MDRLRPGRERGFDDGVAAQVALARRRRADAMRFVAGRDVHGVGVGVGIDRDGAHAHAPRGARDATRDLAAIGDEDAVKHRGRPGDR